MKKKLKNFILFLLVFVLVACANPGGNKSKEDSKIKIGFIGCLTGVEGIYGTTSLNGAKLAVSEINANGGINGKNIELVIEDDKNNTTEAVNAYNKIRDENIVALLGAITSAPSEAVAPNAQNDGLPMLTPTGTQFGITKDRSNVFRVCFTDPFQGITLAKYLAENGYKKVAIMKNNSSDYSTGVYQAFLDQAEELNLKIVADESYGDQDKDFRVQLTKIKDKNPDVLMVPDYYQKDSLITSQAREMGFDNPIVGPDGWDGVLKQIEESSLDILENVYFTNHYSLDDENEKVQNFVSNYRRTYDNDDPSAFSALAYDGVYILADAIGKSKDLDKKEIVDNIKNIKFEGVTGNLSYDENNNPIKSVTIIKIEDGKYTMEDVVK